MKKQQIAGVALAAVLVLGIAMFAGYQSTRYPRTLQAANQAVQAGQEAEAVALYEKAVNVSPKKAEAYLALADTARIFLRRLRSFLLGVRWARGDRLTHKASHRFWFWPAGTWGALVGSG